MYIFIELVLRHCTLCFSIHNYFLTATSVRVGRGFFCTDLEVINLSYVGLGLFGQA